MIPTLRPYQEQFVADLRAAMRKSRRVLAVAPTGAGKTVTFSYISAMSTSKGKRIVITAHRAEIIDQISKALSSFGVRHGRIQPGRTPTNDLVQCAMINTLARRIDSIPAPDLMIPDEAHHIVSPTFMKVVEAWNSSMLLGFTATPQRLDGRGLGTAFDEMVLAPSTRELIEAGYLADYDYLAPEIAVDLSDVKTQAGDFAKGALAEVMDKPKITGSAVGHYRNLLQGRPAVAFCCSIEHAQHVAAEFTAAGFSAASIDGTMTAAERSQRLTALGNGSLNVLTSADLIGEGIDLPAVAGAILLRPTKSLALHLQQIGRALRLKPDGSRAVILDHVGNIHRHGTPKAERQWSLEDRKRTARSEGIRQCKACYRAFGPGEPGECDDRENRFCLFAVEDKARAGREMIETVDGELQAVTETPEWTGGANILTAKGDEWKRLLARARTREQLAAIARARGFKPAWIHMIEQSRRKRA